MQQVAAGLDFLHSKGVCHRDFSLQRILIDPGGTAKVIDAGILGILPDELKQGGLSGSERGYISPEELLGKGPSGEADRYRFTVACFELVAGTIPFVGDSPMELREDILSGKITIPSARNRNLPRHLVKVFEKALSRDLADRPTTASHLIKPLSHTASHYTGLALAGNNPIEKKDVNPGRASRVPRALTVVGLGALFGIAILSSRLGRIVAPQQKAHSSLAVQQVFQPSSGDNNQNGGGNGAKGLVSGELLSIARRRTGAEDELIPALESILNGSPTSPVTAQQRELLSLATRHDNPAIRRFVVKVISSREVTELGGELLELLLDDSPTVRSAAIQALQTTLAPVPVSTLALRAAGESDPLIHSKIMELARALEVEGRLSKGHQR
jgi:serine/threonine protein kinase